MSELRQPGGISMEQSTHSAMLGRSPHISAAITWIGMLLSEGGGGWCLSL